jgi:hypothetical protein
MAVPQRDTCREHGNSKIDHVGSVDVVADILDHYASGTTTGISSAGFRQSTVDALAGGRRRAESISGRT